jgi:hypothetical protein
MSVPSEVSEIQGADELHEWFGYWPDFHDAEIMSLHLNRKGTSSLSVHTWEMTKEVDAKGYYIITKHVVVEFVLELVSGLTLNGFNHQNVISGLVVEKIDSGFRLTLDECYGVAGILEAQNVTLRLTPGKPS